MGENGDGVAVGQEIQSKVAIDDGAPIKGKGPHSEITTTKDDRTAPIKICDYWIAHGWCHGGGAGKTCKKGFHPAKGDYEMFKAAAPIKIKATKEAIEMQLA